MVSNGFSNGTLKVWFAVADPDDPWEEGRPVGLPQSEYSFGSDATHWNSDWEEAEQIDPMDDSEDISCYQCTSLFQCPLFVPILCWNVKFSIFEM
jgi:hypothetical protein